MRYAIGCSIINKRTLKPIEGIYVEGTFGTAYICCDETKDVSNSKIAVFDTPEDAVAYTRKLSKIYDLEFTQRAKASRFDRDKFRFYPVKVDSDKFSLRLTKQLSSASKDHIHWKEYAFEKK